MVALTLQNSEHKILIVGPIYDKIEKLEKIKNISINYDLIILNGNICYPFENIEERINYLSKYLSEKIIYNLGNYDLEVLSKTKSNKIKQWINTKSNIILITFNNQTSMIITSGGITPEMTKNKLHDNIETSFVSFINKKPWHEFYGGGYGYVISNNPLTSKPPQFYNFSAQIGNYYSKNNQLYAQEADQYGLKQTILL